MRPKRRPKASPLPSANERIESGKRRSKVILVPLIPKVATPGNAGEKHTEFRPVLPRRATKF